MKYILKSFLLLSSFILLSSCLGVPVKRVMKQAVLLENQSELSHIITQCMSESNPTVLQPWLDKNVYMKNDYGEEAHAEWEVLSDLSLFFEEHIYYDFEIDYQVISVDKKNEFVSGQYTDTENKIYNITVHAEEGRIYKITISAEPVHVPSACDFFNCSLGTI